LNWPVDGSYDFLYLPMQAGGKSTLGYAFINRTSRAHAAAFFSRWQTARLRTFESGRRLKITAADLQGFEANVGQLMVKQSGSLRSRNCRSVVLRGQEVRFDEF